ncbi:MAG TPA: hypothetical protein VFF73_20760 [Planctomycetota bacterium]|nr:hypothetical protein [Planctomycetota bacterium]
MNDDRRTDSEIDQRRRELDRAQSGRRADADRARDDQRGLVDGTRQTARGTSQSRESLDRERAREDASLGAERALADIARAAERALADAALAREKQARSDSDAALEHRVDLDARRRATLREALGLLDEQMAVVDGSLSELLATVPRGTFDGRLSADVEKIRSAGVRMRTLLGDVLDPDDARRRDHDVGGSG